MIFTALCFFLNLMVFGATVLVHFVYYNAIFMENADYAYDFSLLIAISACIVVSFCGCCCYKKNQIIIFGIGVILLFLFILGFIEGITDYIRFEHLTEELIDVRFTITLPLYNVNPKMKIYWDKMHGKKCCGINGPDDWASIDNGSIPLSCCQENSLNVTLSCLKDDAYNQGCKDKFVDEINKMSCILMTISGIIAIMQICVLVITCCAISSPKKDNQMINFDSISTENSHILPNEICDINENETGTLDSIKNIPNRPLTAGRRRNQFSKASNLYSVVDGAIQHKLRRLTMNPIE